MPKKPTDIDIPVSQVQSAFEYDPIKGHIFYKNPARFNMRATIGARADKLCKRTGYRFVIFCGRRLRAHRLAFAIFYNRWPDNFIDHKNGDKSDNSINNLQDVTHRENTLRARSRLKKRVSEGGVNIEFGVFRHDPGYKVVKFSHGVYNYGGYFKTLDEANEKAKQMDEMLGLSR